MSKANDGLKAKGFFRLTVTEGDKVVGDSGWKENTITMLGKEQYLCNLIAGTTGSKYIQSVAIGAGTDTIASNATGLTSEFSTANGSYTRMPVTVTTSVNGSTAIVQFAFAQAASVLATATTLAEVALINATATGGQIFSGNTFTASALATNQAVNGSYEIRFS